MFHHIVRMSNGPNFDYKPADFSLLLYCLEKLLCELLFFTHYFIDFYSENLKIRAVGTNLVPTFRNKIDESMQLGWSREKAHVPEVRDARDCLAPVTVL